ncbi:hypothetical protein GDO86_002566 [Hymenochirus boettgeri]|uniref:F-BAR domain-containing protein n=1 Tax=Hymenochirus boettgeri TaxID=247094 RepID=A0A8T2KIU6_9PIPI|nr:hypothetical protein GDO86_002566 [Hymenochirus boettgeri]
MESFCFMPQSPDIIANTGYECLILHMNDGRKNCKEYEEFLKESTLKRALDIFKQQIDNIGQCHIQLAQILRDEARKMEEFRERQKQERKKIEAVMEAFHKQKQLQYKKTMESKRNYEQRCRDKEDAEQAVSRCKNTVNPRQQEKVFAKLAHCKVSLEDSDKTYQHNISLLDKIREDWQKEHIISCEFFENQEWDRINFFRNTVWIHVNQLSQQCVTSDGIYEEIRKALECCNIEKDIEYFTENSKTGNIPPAPVAYENYYYNQRNNPAPVRNQGIPGIR